MPLDTPRTVQPVCTCCTQRGRSPGGRSTTTSGRLPDTAGAGENVGQSDHRVLPLRHCSTESAGLRCLHRHRASPPHRKESARVRVSQHPPSITPGAAHPPQSSRSHRRSSGGKGRPPSHRLSQAPHSPSSPPDSGESLHLPGVPGLDQRVSLCSPLLSAPSSPSRSPPPPVTPCTAPRRTACSSRRCPAAARPTGLRSSGSSAYFCGPCSCFAGVEARSNPRSGRRRPPGTSHPEVPAMPTRIMSCVTTHAARRASLQDTPPPARLISRCPGACLDS